MPYADYEYYACVYLGTLLSDSDFQTFAVKASAYVDYVTMGRAKNASGDAAEAVKNAVCAICEVIQDGEKLNAISSDATRPVSSETVGGWSLAFPGGTLCAPPIQLERRGGQ